MTMPEKITFTVNSDGLNATLINIHELLLSNQKTTIEHHTALDNLNIKLSEIAAMLESLQIQGSARVTSSPAQLQIQEVMHKEVQTINREEEDSSSPSSTVSCDSHWGPSNPDWDMALARVDDVAHDIKTPDEMALTADADGTGEPEAKPAKLNLSPEAPTFTPRKHEEDRDRVSSPPSQPQHVTRSPKSIGTITALNVVEVLLEGGLQHVNNELSTVVDMAKDTIGPAIVAGLSDSLQHVLGCEVKDLRFQLTEFKMGSTRYCAAQLIQGTSKKCVAQSYAIPWIGDTDAKPKFIKMFAMRSDLEKFVEHALGKLPVGGLMLFDLSAPDSAEATQGRRNSPGLISSGSFGTLRDLGSQHDLNSMYRSSGSTLRDMYHQSDRGSVGSLSRGTDHNTFTASSNAPQSGSHKTDDSVTKPYFAKPGPHSLHTMPSRGGTPRNGWRGSPSGLNLRDRSSVASRLGQDVSTHGMAEGGRGGSSPRSRGPHKTEYNSNGGGGVRERW